MPEQQVIRPSTKLVIAGYVFIAILLAAAAFVLYSVAEKPFQPWHTLALLLFVFPLKRHIASRLVTLSIDTDHLTFETGLLSRSRRTIDLAKVQDVTAKQTIGQRMLGTGDLALETAGERSAMVMERIDNPRAVADMIIARSREAVRQRAQGAV